MRNHKRIYDAISEAELAFSMREERLNELQFVEVAPLIERLIEKMNRETLTEQNRRSFIKDLTYVQEQLTLRGKFRKQFSIIRKI